MTNHFRTLAMLAILMAALPASARAGDDESNAIDDVPHITIIGTARADIAPDLATITLGVTTERLNARDASNENSRAAQVVLAAAKAGGIAPTDIATQAVTLNETFDDLHDASGGFTGRRSRGFTATNMMAIKLRDLAKAGGMAQSLIEAGANRFEGIGFSVEHPEPTLDRLASEAVRNARRQAAMVADAAGVKLGPVLSIERPAVEKGGAMPVFAARMKAASPSMPLEAGTTTFVSEMEVTWAIER